MTTVQFGWSSPHGHNWGSKADSGISVEEWAQMTAEQQQSAFDDWLFGNGEIEGWSDPEIKMPESQRRTVTPEQIEAAAKDLSGLVSRVQLWDKLEEDDREYWRDKVRAVLAHAGLSVDGAE
jgi:hypothetical protein